MQYTSTCLNRPHPSLRLALKLLFGGPPLADGTLKLNTDGSRLHGLAACGGLLRDTMGQFICGFHYNLGSASSILAELWGVIHGLRLAANLGVQRLIVEVILKSLLE